MMARCGTRPKMTTLEPTMIAVTQTVVSRPALGLGLGLWGRLRGVTQTVVSRPV